MLSLFPRDVLDETWDFIESVSESFPIYSRRCILFAFPYLSFGPITAFLKRNCSIFVMTMTMNRHCLNLDSTLCASWVSNQYLVKTLNIGTPRPATVVVLNIKKFNFTMK